MMVFVHGAAGGWDELVIAAVAFAVLWLAVKLAGRKPAESDDEQDAAPDQVPAEVTPDQVPAEAAPDGVPAEAAPDGVPAQVDAARTQPAPPRATKPG